MIFLKSFAYRGAYSSKQFIDEHNGNTGCQTEEIYTHDFGVAVFLEVIEARRHYAQRKKYCKNAQQKDYSSG